MNIALFLVITLVAVTMLATWPPLPQRLVERLGRLAGPVKWIRSIFVIGLGAVFVLSSLKAGTPKWVVVLEGREPTILIERFRPGKGPNRSWISVDATDGRFLASKFVEGLFNFDYKSFKGVAAGHLLCSDFEGKLYAVDPRNLDVLLDDEAIRAKAAADLGMNETAVRRLRVKKLANGTSGLEIVTSTGNTQRVGNLGPGRGVVTHPRPGGRWRLRSGKIKAELVRYDSKKGTVTTGLSFIQAKLVYSGADLAVVAAYREVDRRDSAYLTGVSTGGKILWEVPGAEFGLGSGEVARVAGIADDLVVISSGLRVSANLLDKFLSNTYIIAARISQETGEVRWAAHF